jgi:DNA-binding MarR family transcriptional regulator
MVAVSTILLFLAYTRPVRDDDGVAAWGELEMTRGIVSGALSRRLEAEAGLSLSEQEVLYRLVTASGERLRMVELAALLPMGKSGITRLIDRLVQRGWVKREQPADNRRTIYATLTSEGKEMFLRARPVFLGAVEEYFTGRLSRGELAALRGLLGKILTGADPSQVQAGAAG